MKRIGHISIIILFLTVIYTPLILSIINKDREISTSEKRKLAKLPQLEFSLASLNSYPDLFEKYYKDHFGLRETLVELYNYFYFKVMKKSPLPSVTVGRDDWLFYDAEGVLTDFLGLTDYSEEQLENWKRTLDDRLEWFNDQGIRYLFVVAPNKMMIYPEKLPDRIRSNAGTPMLERFSAYLARSRRPSGYLDLRQDLLQSKKSRQVYFRTDTHWNPEGAFEAYTAIMEQVKTWFPDVKVLQERSLKKTRETHRGDICISLNLSNIEPEPAIKTKVEPSCSAGEYERLNPGILGTSGKKIKPGYLPVQNGCPEATLKALVIHDSFGLFLRPYFNETFHKVVYSNYIDLKDLKGLIASEKPDLIIDVRVARHLAGMLEPDSEVEDYILKKHAAVSDDIRLLINGKQGMEHLGGTHDVVVRQSKKGILLQAVGNDPYLEVNFDSATGGDPVLVSISLDSPQDTELQVFYTTPSAAAFSKEKQVSRQIKRGENELLFRLPHPRTAGKIRLDPGMAEGNYILRSLVITRENSGKGREGVASGN